MSSIFGSAELPLGMEALVLFVSFLERDELTGNSEEDRVKMNQLQNLLHDALIATEHVENCAIIRRRDVSLRASSAGFSVNSDQIQRFIDAFKDPSATREKGLYFNDRMYQCVRADKSSIYAKASTEKLGVVLVRTGTLIFIGTYNENMYASVCVEAVEKLASYFKEKDK
ncbi:profilin-4-like isoform X2 [Asterias amurensis]|uniref:profilin-4-like isoform X2 n=1 Tax=Asterias amurensis TaxID=7602 RepID=UPI003AB22D66